MEKFGDEAFIYLIREGQRAGREEDDYGTSGSREIQCGAICAGEDLGAGADKEDE